MINSKINSKINNEINRINLTTDCPYSYSVLRGWSWPGLSSCRYDDTTSASACSVAPASAEGVSATDGSDSPRRWYGVASAPGAWPSSCLTCERTWALVTRPSTGYAWPGSMEYSSGSAGGSVARPTDRRPAARGVLSGMAGRSGVKSAPPVKSSSRSKSDAGAPRTVTRALQSAHVAAHKEHLTTQQNIPTQLKRHA